MTPSDQRPKATDAASEKPARVRVKVPEDLLPLAQQALREREERKRREKEAEERKQRLAREREEARKAETAEAYRAARRAFTRWRAAVQAAQLPLVSLGKWVPGAYSRAFALVLPTPLPVSGQRLRLWMSDYVKQGQIELYVGDIHVDTHGNETPLGNDDLRFIVGYFEGQQVWDDLREAIRKAG